ncbi:MAG: response regulator [Gemmatimonadetes bacterium]|nr:response regulator [Gemmatimonadota bacterium]
MTPPTILVVDDHADSRVICEIILGRNGYSVLSAAEGDRALELARTEQPAAIVLDIALPRMDGWSVVEELKKEPLTAGIPVLMYTAHSLDSYRSRAMELGCVAFLVKPCSPQAILEAVQHCVSPPAPRGKPLPSPA